MPGNNDDLDSTLIPSANERFIQTIPLKEFSDSNDDYCVYFITTLPGCGEYVLEQGASSDQNTVIHLDMKDLAAGNLRTLAMSMLEMVKCAIGKHGRQLPDFGQSNVTSALESLLTSKFSADDRVEWCNTSIYIAYTAFKKLLRSLKEECGTKVMLLIQNYDRPVTDILSQVNNEQDASQLYDQYCDFIRGVASNSECIRCVVMTGRLPFQITNFPDPDKLGGSYTYLSFKKHEFNKYFAMTEDQLSKECQKLSVSDGIKKALMGAYSVKIDNDVYLRTAPTISFLKRFRKNENADVLESNHFIEHSFLVTLQSHFHDGDLYNLLSKVVKRFENGEPFLPFEKFSPINEFNPEVFLTFSNMLELRNLSKRGLNMPQESLHDFVRYLCHLSLLWPQKQDNAWSIGIPNVQSCSTLKYERQKALGLLSKIPKIRSQAMHHLTELFKRTDNTSRLKELCTCYAHFLHYCSRATGILLKDLNEHYYVNEFCYMTRNEALDNTLKTLPEARSFIKYETGSGDIDYNMTGRPDLYLRNKENSLHMLIEFKMEHSVRHYSTDGKKLITADYETSITDLFLRGKEQVFLYKKVIENVSQNEQKKIANLNLEEYRYIVVIINSAQNKVYMKGYMRGTGWESESEVVESNIKPQKAHEGSTSASSAHSAGSSTPSGSTRSRPDKRKHGSTGDSASTSTSGLERFFSKENARCDENSDFPSDYTRDFDSFQSDSYPDQVAGKFDNSNADDMMEEDD